MTITVYRASSIIVALAGAAKYELVKKVMGDDLINLSFDYYEPVDFKIGDYITYNSVNYQLNQLPTVNKESSNKFTYDCVFEGSHYELGKVPFMLFGEGEFALTGDANTFMDLIISNLNSWFGGVTWTKGTVLSGTDYKSLSFNSENCLEVLNRFAKEFDTEFYLVNKQLNFTTFGTDNGLIFKYGQGNALYKINRGNVSSKNIITRLYPFGSTKNLPASYGAKRLKLSTGFIEQNVVSYGKIGTTHNFEEIYPHRTGAVSSVDVADVTKFVDSGMDFDVNNYQLLGVKPKLTFKTGTLAGYVFEISYVHATKTFTIYYIQEPGIGSLPNASLKPAATNKYVITDISLPQSYIDTAEAELLTKATAYLNQNSSPNVAYKVDCNPLYFKENDISITSGNYVTITDTDLQINRLIRIIAFRLDLVHGKNYDIDLADTIEPSIASRIYAQTLETKRVILNNELADPTAVLKRDMTIEQIGDFTADNKLTPVEKLQIRKEWQSINAEKVLFVTQATAYGLTTEKTSYEAAFVALGTLLNAGIAYTANIPALIADAVLTRTDDVSGANLRTAFSNYYDTRTALINKLTNLATAKAFADGLVTAGTIQVADTTTVKAGMTGAAKVVGSLLASAVRFWAGGIFANRETAAFRVMEDGKMYATGCEILIENSHYGIKLDSVNNKIAILGAGGVIGEIMGSFAGESLSGETYDYNFGKVVLYRRNGAGGIENTISLSPFGLKLNNDYIVDSSGNLKVPGEALLTGRATISSPFVMPKGLNGDMPVNPVEGLSFYQDYIGGRRLYTYIAANWRYIQYS